MHAAHDHDEPAPPPPPAPPAPAPYVLRVGEGEGDDEAEALSGAALQRVQLASANDRQLAPPPPKALDGLTELQLTLRRRREEKKLPVEEITAAVRAFDDLRFCKSLDEQKRIVDEMTRLEKLTTFKHEDWPAHDVEQCRRALGLYATVEQNLVRASSAKTIDIALLSDLLQIPPMHANIRERNSERFQLHLALEDQAVTMKRVVVDLITRLFEQSFERLVQAERASAIGARFHIDKAQTGLRDAIAATKQAKQHLDEKQAFALEVIVTKAEAALSGSSLRASSGSLGDSNVALRSSGPNKGPSLPVFDAVIGGNVAALAALADEQVHVVNARGDTALFAAAARGDVVMADALLARGLSASTVNAVSKGTPLHMAAVFSLETLERLLNEPGVESALTCANREGDTPLALVCKHAAKHAARNSSLLCELVLRLLTPGCEESLKMLSLKLASSVERAGSVVNESALDLSAYLFSQTHADVVLVMDDGVELPAHRIVLCSQSPAFRGLLETSEMRETQSHRVALHDVSSDAMRVILTHLYTRAISIRPHEEARAIDALQAADRFLLPQLVAVIGSRLAAVVDVENCFVLLEGTQHVNDASARFVRAAAARCVLDNYAVLAEHDQDGHYYLSMALEALASAAKKAPDLVKKARLDAPVAVATLLLEDVLPEVKPHDDLLAADLCLPACLAAGPVSDPSHPLVDWSALVAHAVRAPSWERNAVLLSAKELVRGAVLQPLPPMRWGTTLCDDLSWERPCCLQAPLTVATPELCTSLPLPCVGVFLLAASSAAIGLPVAVPALPDALELMPSPPEDGMDSGPATATAASVVDTVGAADPAPVMSPPLFKHPWGGGRMLALSTAQAAMVSVAPLPAVPALRSIAADAQLFPTDLLCPEAGAVRFALPRVASTLLTPSGELVPPARVNLVALELQLPLVRLARPEEASRFGGNRDWTLAWPVAPRALLPSVRSGQVFAMSPVEPRAPVLAPMRIPLSFQSSVKIVEDDKFIANARAEAQLMSGYNDSGRGDLHHFFAVAAEFAAVADAFVKAAVHATRPASSTAPSEPLPPPVAKKQKQLAPPTLSGRTAIPSVAVAETMDDSTWYAEPADALASFMALRGADAKLTWQLQAFAAGDVRASDQVLAALDRRSVLLLSGAFKSFLPTVLLVAAKWASRHGAAIIIAASQEALWALLDVCSSSFGQVQFVRSADKAGKNRVACVAAARPAMQLSNDALVVLCGEAAVLESASAVQATAAHVVYALHDPLQARCWSTASADPECVCLVQHSVPTAVVPCLLREPLQQLISRVEQQLDAVCAPLAHARVVPASLYRMLSRNSLSWSLRSFPSPATAATVPLLLDLAVLAMAKEWLDLLASQSDSFALAYLRRCFEHPSFGSHLRARLEWCTEDQSLHCATPQHPKQSALCALVNGAAPAVVLAASCAAATDTAAALSDASVWSPGAQFSSSRVWVLACTKLDPMFPWREVCTIVVADDARTSAVPDALEAIRMRCNGALEVQWALSSYELCRGSALLAHRTLHKCTVPPPPGDSLLAHMIQQLHAVPTAAEVASVFALSWPPLAPAPVSQPGSVGMRVVVSAALLSASPHLASALATRLQLVPVVRTRLEAADVIVDEARCVLVRSLEEYINIDALSLELFRVALAFEHCTLLLRYRAPLKAVPARLLHALYAHALPRLLPLLRVRVVLSVHDSEADHVVELHALAHTVRESLTHSRLAGSVERPWLPVEETAHERVLCAIPCVSPLTAHVIFTRISLSLLFRTTRSTVHEKLSPLLPARVLAGLLAVASLQAPSRDATMVKRAADLDATAARRAELLREYPSSYGFATRRDATLNYAVVPGNKGQTRLTWNKKNVQ